MKKMFKGSLIVAVLVSAAIFFSGFYGVRADAAEDAAPKIVGAAPGVFFAGSGHPGFILSDVHQKKYLTYLVKEYSPESIGQWEAAFAERSRVVADGPKKFKIKFKEAISGQVSGGAAAQDEVILQAPQPDAPLPAPGMKKFVIKLKDHMKIAESGNDDVLEFSSEKISPEMEQKMEEFKAQAKVQEEFEKAVSSDDGAAIKELLPKILEGYKKATTQMEEMNEKIKKEMDSSEIND